MILDKLELHSDNSYSKFNENFACTTHLHVITVSYYKVSKFCFVNQLFDLYRVRQNEHPYLLLSLVYW